MKKLFFLPLSLFFISQIVAQKATDWGAFNQWVDAAAFRGKKFKVEAAVKVVLIDSTADAEVWVRVDRTNKQMGFFYNMMDKPIRSSQWKVYTIEGEVAKDAATIFFGGLYHRKGLFYYDDFRFFIKNGSGNWEEQELPDNGFEGDSSLIRKTWNYARVDAPVVFPAGVTSEEAFSGKCSFKVDGSKMQFADIYGNNSHTGKFANVNNCRFYYEIYGSGEPLLLLHGNSSSIVSFEKQIPELAKKFRVIAIDTRGQGRSGEDGRTYSYDLFADDMNAFLDYLELDSVNILGWSDGGNTGLIMAMKYPKKVKRLVTMGANIFIDHSVVDNWVFKKLNKEKKEIEGDTTYNSENRLRLINLLLTEPRHRFDELKSITCPVLVIAGEKDVIREKHTRSIAEAIPNSHLLIAKGETHYFPSENPSAFNKFVIEFLQTH